MAGETRLLAADDTAAVPDAVRLIAAGALVAFPTDTVYGVGCDPWSAAAIERLYAAKERPLRMAIPVLVASPEDVAQVAEPPDDRAVRLMARFWPGALTVVVRRRSEVPAILSAGGPTVAVRMPDHDLALRLIAAAGGALAATSANRSGRPSPEDAGAVLADLEGRIALVIDGGRAPIGVPSSIVDLTTDPPRLLREGHLSLAILREALPALEPGR